MGSNYNSRALTTEVLVNGRQSAAVRERQPLEIIWEAEGIPAWLTKTA